MSSRIHCALAATVCALVLAACAVSTTNTREQSENTRSVCTRTQFSVHASDAEPTIYKIAGELCKKGRGAKTILVTSHGATYNHLYWNWGVSPDTYSFVQNMPAKVDILNVDLLGVGESDHPPSAVTGSGAEAHVLHQLVQTMRSRGYTRVILVGHSSGAGQVVREASKYHDVDGIIVTGFLHGFADGSIVVAVLYPASSDPMFASLKLDPGYVTSKPGKKANTGFYNLAVVDPAVLAFDEAHKDVVSFPAIQDFLEVISTPAISQAINVPVLSLQAQYDAGFCTLPDCPQAALEASAWSAAAKLELHVIPVAGHDIHLHQAGASAEYEYIRTWLAANFPE
jgi:pimeloyl-ACP methyl ester carboxylesterase